MNIDTTILQHYLQQKPYPSTYAWVYEATKGRRKIEMHRQDVVEALLKQLSLYASQGYPLWNQRLIHTLFQTELAKVEEVILLPIVGANASFDGALYTHEGNIYLLIDFLNIADYTPMLSQMTYILHNLMHVQLAQYLIKQRHPDNPTNFFTYLETSFFMDGLSQYLSWNEDVCATSFQDTSYDKRKEAAFGLLYQAIQIQEMETQKTIIDSLQSASFWNRFPQAAGMFFMDDVYQAKKEKGLRAVYTHGPSEIFSIVFEQ